ncbi:hypothetical protein Ddc_15818 [Ditylenchus destructor]|nr:hypothetical protein Ddc_15818 [Ditylenchus destructor]
MFQDSQQYACHLGYMRLFGYIFCVCSVMALTELISHSPTYPCHLFETALSKISHPPQECWAETFKYLKLGASVRHTEKTVGMGSAEKIACQPFYLFRPGPSQIANFLDSPSEPAGGEGSGQCPGSHSSGRCRSIVSNSTIVNMATRFECSQCPTILNASERRSHISARHLRYFPYECPTCTEANKKHLETTEADMNEHIATYHNGNNLTISFLKNPDEEVELDTMIQQCQCLPTRQIPSNDSKRDLHRVFNLLGGAGTLTGNGNVAQNGSGLTQVKDEDGSDDDVMIIEHGNETAAMPNNSLSGNLPEQPAQTETKEPYKQSIAPSNTPNCVNTEGPQAIMPKTEPFINSSITPEPHNFTESYSEMDFPRQSTCGRKRELPDNVSNYSFESREKRRLVTNDEHLESGGHCSRDVNHDKNVERPTTSSQVTSSVPADSSSKQTITKLFIVISEGIVYFETSDRTKHKYAPLSERLKILRESVLANDYDVEIQFNASDRGIPYQYIKTVDEPVKEFDSLEQLKTFRNQMRSISHLLSHSIITAYFGHFQQKSKKSPTQDDYCTVLFGQDSILKCKGLYITIVEYWPLSVVTNVMDQCATCELHLEEALGVIRRTHHLYDYLDDICGGVLERIDNISFHTNNYATVDGFIDKLKKQFQDSPHQRFKFGLCSPSEIKFKEKSNGHILEAKRVEKATKDYSTWAIIEQYAAGS